MTRSAGRTLVFSTVFVGVAASAMRAQPRRQGNPEEFLPANVTQVTAFGERTGHFAHAGFLRVQFLRMP
jgi:hypothetical protein